MSEVREVPERSLFEIRVGGEHAGRAEYELRSGRMVLTHTVVDDAHRGQGLAAQLARAALDAARERGLRVVPECSYIADYVAKHPEYADLVD
ncbi:MAG: GNAT family N-acetyltransferase [Saccharopolyspora rectivirgula]